LQQTVELPKVQTVSGEAPLTLTSNAVGRTFTGMVVVQATKEKA